MFNRLATLGSNFFAQHLNIFSCAEKLRDPSLVWTEETAVEFRFLEPSNYEPLNNSIKSRVPHFSQTLEFNPRFLKLTDFQSNFQIPWRFEKSGFRCNSRMANREILGRSFPSSFFIIHVIHFVSYLSVVSFDVMIISFILKMPLDHHFL